MFRKKVYLFSLLLLCIIALTACADSGDAGIQASHSPYYFDDIDEFLAYKQSGGKLITDSQILQFEKAEPLFTTVYQPSKLPEGAKFSHIATKNGIWVTLNYSLFVGNTDIPTDLISVSTYSGNPDGLLKSIVYNNIE